MLRTSLFFFGIGILALALAMTRTAGVSFETGKWVLTVSLLFAVLTFIASLGSQVIMSPGRGNGTEEDPRPQL